MPKKRKRKTSQVPITRKIRKVASEPTAQGADEDELQWENINTDDNLYRVQVDTSISIYPILVVRSSVTMIDLFKRFVPMELVQKLIKNVKEENTDALLIKGNTFLDLNPYKVYSSLAVRARIQAVEPKPSSKLGIGKPGYVKTAIMQS